MIVHPHFHPRRTGVTRHVESVVQALSAKQEVRVLGRALDPALATISWRELWRRSRREPVLWHAHRNNELLAGILLRALGAKLRLVFTRHSWGRPGAYTRLLMRFAHRVVALTPQMAELLPGAAVVGHGVELDRFQPPADRGAAWEALGLGGTYGLLFVGRVREDKGALDFAEAAAPLLREFPHWRAVFVGRADPALRKRIEALSADFRFVDELRSIEPWYQGATVVVQPSWIESYALVRLEAMASACCLIASDLPQLPTFIEAGKSGLLFPARDIGALRAALQQVMEGPEQAARMGAEAAERVRERFGVEHEAAALAALYQELGVPAGEAVDPLRSDVP